MSGRPKVWGLSGSYDQLEAILSRRSKVWSLVAVRWITPHWAKHARNSEYQVWTHENHAVELFSKEFTQQKLDYIHQTPVRAGIVDAPEDYV
jgi:hypothetical protein